MSARQLRSTESIHHLATSLDSVQTLEWLAAMHANSFHALDAVTAALPEIALLADRVARAIGNGGRLVLAGAGTSGRLGALEAAECPPTFATDPGTIVALMAGGPDALVAAIEGAEDDARAGEVALQDERIGDNDVVVGISASGSTPWVRGVLRAAQATGATTGAIVCNRSALIAALADICVELETGAEFVAGSTRLNAATAQKLALNLITTGAMRALGRVRSGRMVALRATNAKLYDRAVRIVCEFTGLDSQTAEKRLAAANGDVALALTQVAEAAPTQSHNHAASTSTQTDLIVRPITPTDLSALNSLASQPSVIEGTAPFIELYGDGLFGDWIAHDGCMLSALRDGELLGVLLAEPSSSILRRHVLDIGFIAVDPAVRGQGVGDRLLVEMLAWARARELTRIELRVWPENEPAIRLYERHGFQIEGRLRKHALVNGLLRDAFVMAWIDPHSS